MERINFLIDKFNVDTNSYFKINLSNMKPIMNFDMYDKILQNNLYVSINNNYKDTINTMLKQLVDLYLIEKKVRFQDYVPLINALEYSINENNFFSFPERNDVIKYFKDQIQFYQNVYFKDQCLKQNLNYEEMSKNFDILNNFKIALSNYYNNLVNKYANMFNVVNKYKLTNINININLEDFRKAILKHLKFYPTHYYITKNKLISHIKNFSGNDLEKLFSFFESKRMDSLNYYKEQIKMLLKRQSRFIDKKESNEIEQKLKVYKELFLYYNKNLVERPEMITTLWTGKNAFAENEDNSLGRYFNHRQLSSSKLPKSREDAIEKYKITNNNPNLINIINYPQLRNNAEDIVNILYTLRNILMFLNTDVYVEKYNPFIFNKERQIPKGLIYRDYFELDGTLKEKIKKLNIPIRFTQKEFALNDKQIQELLKTHKMLLDSFKTKNGKYQISYSRDLHLLFIREQIKLKDEIEDILYVLPNGNLDLAQQIFRIDRVNYDNTNLAMLHNPTGSNTTIQSYSHSHTYDLIDTLFKQIKPDGSPTPKKLAHYEIDRVLAPFVNIHDVNKFLNMYLHLETDKRLYSTVW